MTRAGLGGKGSCSRNVNVAILFILDAYALDVSTTLHTHQLASAPTDGALKHPLFLPLLTSRSTTTITQRTVLRYRVTSLASSGP
jgi:hypothetical protein